MVNTCWCLSVTFTATHASWVWFVVLCALATTCLIIACRSRWARQRPLAHYVLWSIYGHAILMIYASTLCWLPAPVRYTVRSSIDLLEIGPEDTNLDGLVDVVATHVDSPEGNPSDMASLTGRTPSAEQFGSMDTTPHPESSDAVTDAPTLIADPLADGHDQSANSTTDHARSDGCASVDDDESVTSQDASARSASSTLMDAWETPSGSSSELARSDNVHAERQEQTVEPEPSKTIAAETRNGEFPPVSIDEESLLNARPSDVASVEGSPALSPLQTPRALSSNGEVGSTAVARADDPAHTAAGADQAVPPLRRKLDGQTIPKIYQQRFLPNRIQLVERWGGSLQTERAVGRALQWLAENQSSDGRWSARLHGAGQERRVFGQDRQGAGGDADTGVTALAVLAFLGAGHTHADGPYREQLERAVMFLTRQQAGDGNLAGATGTYAAMYCHGISLLALAEAYALTGDRRLVPVIERAQRYTLAAQSAVDGGWRYRPGDFQGDTSQFGWQLMALKSAELAGWPIPAAHRTRMEYFLTTVSSGAHGGLASYRAAMAPTAPMTAEAMVCRHLLQVPHPPEQQDEAASLILRDLPTRRPANLYYWYYASLALFMSNHRAWPVWNEHLTRELLALQIAEGAHAGSWDTDTVWGGYGGRVYTTSLAALCLEVYYRFDRDQVHYAATPWQAERPRGLLPR